MMPVVRVSDGTFADLSTLKTWYGTKTPSETIDRAIQAAMEQLGIERDDAPEQAAGKATDGAMEFQATPGLGHTKVLGASVAGTALQTSYWLTVLLAVVEQVKAKGLEGDKLAHELGIPAKATRYEVEGYKFHESLGISIQGQSAQDAWKEIERLANKWHIPVTVEFQWRQNPKAQFPGKVGVLRAGDGKL